MRLGITRRRRSLALVMLLVAAGCGDEAAFAPVAQPATLEQLTGPWQAAPLVLAEDLHARVEQTCRTDMERRPGSRAGVIDVRGGGVAVVRMIGEGAGACEALEITETGEVHSAGGGWTNNQLEVLDPIDATALSGVESGTVQGGSLAVTGRSVIGRAGQDVATVVVETPRGTVTATLQNGWFAAWWPVPRPQVDGGAPAGPPVLVRAFDAAGGLVDEQTVALR